jgi:hypothetical protein
VGLCIPLTLLGNKKLKTSPRQWRFARVVVFYAVCPISRESITSFQKLLLEVYVIC